MIFLSHTAHWQFLGLVLGVLAWIFVLITTGQNEWRLWYVEDDSVITSGVAWVGIWKVCFYSHVLHQQENCWSISISDTFAPVEIHIAQVLLVLAMFCGLAGNITAALAMRMVYFSLKERRNLRLLFLLAGTLYLLTAGLCLVPLVWNMISIYNNNSIDFPPKFHLPAAPERQRVGSAIGFGLFASILLLFSGVLFLCYQYAWESLSPEPPRVNGDAPPVSNGSNFGQDNPAFHTDEVS